MKIVQKYLVSFFTLVLVLNLALVVGCKKPSQAPDEDAATYKKRLLLVYLAKASVGVKAASSAINAVHKGGKFTDAQAKALYNLDNKVVTSLGVVRDRISAGLGSDAIDAIDAIISDVQTFESLGVFTLPEDGRSQFFIITNGLRTTLVTIKSVLQASKEPNNTVVALKAKAAVERAQANASNPQWVFDLINIVIAAYGEAESLANLLTVEETLAAITAQLSTAKNLNDQYLSAIG